MGGFTTVVLRDKSEENIARQNQRLIDMGLAKKYHFYSVKDVEYEYEWFKKGKGVFPEDQFPRDRIHSFADFRRYWNPRALGEVFCPEYGTLRFDSYFGRTTLKNMRIIRNYIVQNVKIIESVNGSFETLLEKTGASPIDINILREYHFIT